MSEMNNNVDKCLSMARSLAKSIEEGNEKEADRIIDEIIKLRESSLFQEVGKLTRQLHETLNSFQLDSRILSLAESDIPDAKERLNYVITMTEQSANRTLNAVEKAFPISEQLKEKSSNLEKKWDRFRQRQMPVNEFRELSGEIGEFMVWTARNAEHIHEHLSDVMMAQDFQDITGQIIRRVINMVQEVESGLVELVRISGQRMIPVEKTGVNKVSIEGDGPRIPGCESHKDRVSGQDDVDDLLSSLGF